MLLSFIILGFLTAFVYQSALLCLPSAFQKQLRRMDITQNNRYSTETREASKAQDEGKKGMGVGLEEGNSNRNYTEEPCHFSLGCDSTAA